MYIKAKGLVFQSTFLVNESIEVKHFKLKILGKTKTEKDNY